MSSYDLVIIGGGPGGYNAAIRAGQLGLRTAVIERCATLGGTCLNVGCIPSKSLLHASSLFEQAGRDFASLGIEVAPRLNLPAMMKQKEEAVAQLTRGVAFLLKKNKVDWVNGAARLLGAGRLEAKDQAGEVQVLEAGSILIASGSVPARLAGIEVDGERIVDSTGALSFSEVPRRLAVIGAGIIGLELGSVWRRLGSEVVVLEYLDRVTPGIDAEIASQLQRALIRQGMAFRLGVRVQGAMRKGEGVEITFSPTAKDGDEGKAEKIEAERVLLAVGRSPNTEGLGLEALGIATDSRGFIETEAFRTSAPGVFAIGDVTRGPMLAHKAEDEAVACVELLAGRAGFADPEVIPSVIYTTPEVAVVGKTEEELTTAGVAYRAGRFPFTANARAKVNHEAEGLVKVLADAASDRILGVHMIGPDVSELIGEACLAMTFAAASEDVARTCHPHPTRSEALRQAAMAVDGWAMQN